MDQGEKWSWEFWGFESPTEGRPVQDWFDDLPGEAKDEIIDLVRYLRLRTNSRWQRPEFDPLRGSCGISELRTDRIQVERGGLCEEATYRMYGYFGPGEHAYTLLHGTKKEQTNDRPGKQIACERLRQIKLGAATCHRFRFKSRSDLSTKEE